MGRIDKRKKSSAKRKLRRGFHVVRRQKMSNQPSSNEDSTNENPGDVSQLPDNSLPVSTAGEQEVTTAAVKKLLNLNTSFEKFEDENGPTTRERAKQVGLGSRRDIDLLLN